VVGAIGSTLTAVLICCGYGMADERAPATQLPRALDDLPQGIYDGAVSCQQCHTHPRQGEVREGEACDFVLLTEFPIWRFHDKHSLAYVALLGSRGKQMGKLLDQNVLKEKTGCLGCHAMNFPDRRRGSRFRIEDGVSCGGCHGPSRLLDGRGWFDDHSKPQWRKKSQKEKEELGMRDLRDPVKRSALCLSCHIGDPSQGKIVTHAMFAAGHPPLPPIEIATFSANEPQHWRDARDVPYFRKASEDITRNYDLHNLDFQNTRLAVVGSVVALRETMRLVMTRATFKTENPGKIWPELWMPVEGKEPAAVSAEQARERWLELAMAHSDCFACHHDLKTPSERQRRGYSYRLPGSKVIRVVPGRPLVRAWPLTLIELSAALDGRPGELDHLAGHLEKLTNTCNATVFGDPRQIEESAWAIVQWSDRLLERLNAPARTYDEATALRLLHTLGHLKTLDNADYEAARQIGSIFQVVCREWGRKTRRMTRDPKLEEELNELADCLNLRPYTGRRRRFDEMIGIVREVTKEARTEDAGAFSEFIGNVASHDKLKGLVRNNFLREAHVLDLDEFAKNLRTSGLARLEAANEDELKTALEKVSAYKASVFKAKLTALCKRLPPP
jgi:hypothetical protein